ncbi:hypothetical protein BJY00DRAFT_315422 [Aspergillus carlsbadensis]|nr:hypothetical protein BJY00DRAFT_315422 [Aspergillus carlsbadensis]
MSTTLEPIPHHEPSTPMASVSETPRKRRRSQEPDKAEQVAILSAPDLEPDQAHNKRDASDHEDPSDPCPACQHCPCDPYDGRAICYTKLWQGKMAPEVSRPAG